MNATNSLIFKCIFYMQINRSVIPLPVLLFSTVMYSSGNLMIYFKRSLYRGGKDMIEKLRQRRSIRKYTAEAIPKETLKTILTAGLLSPTSKNLHPWEFLVVQDREALTRLAECREKGADMLKGAAAAVIVMADTSLNDVWVEDCSIAMSNMHLTAADQGVGSCWIQIRNRISKQSGISSEAFIKNMFNLEDKYAIEAILSLGMPEKKRPQMTLDDLLWDKVHYESF